MGEPAILGVMVGEIDRAREAFGRQAWADAYAQLLAADQMSPLEFEDLERLAMVAYLTGRDAESDVFWARAHHECLRAGDPASQLQACPIGTSRRHW